MSLEETLTAAERRALTKHIRTTLIDRIRDELMDDLNRTVEKLVTAELSAARKDKAFMAEVRELFRNEVWKTLKRAAEQVEVSL